MRDGCRFKDARMIRALRATRGHFTASTSRVNNNKGGLKTQTTTNEKAQNMIKQHEIWLVFFKLSYYKWNAW